MLYGNYCYIIVENFPQKFSPCTVQMTRKLFYLRGEEVKLIRQKKNIFSIIFIDDTDNIYLFL